jgi:hypothetical protein
MIEAIRRYVSCLPMVAMFVLFGSSYHSFAQCPATPTANPVSYLVTANSTTNYNVAAGEVLVIQSGTYTGSINGINTTGLIYVAPGAIFSPSNIGNPAGRIINCGTANIPGFNLPTMAVTDSFFIQNFGVMNMTGGYNTNGNNSSWLNGIGAKMTFTQSLTNFRDMTFVNNGNVFFMGSLNTGAVTAPRKNTFVNHDSITVYGDIVLDAAIMNDGFLFSKGNMTLNSGGNINNGCFFETDKSFNYSSTDTLFVTGLTWVAMAGGADVAKFQGRAVRISADGFIQGSTFESNGTKFLGNGNLHFTGDTKHQGGDPGGFGADNTPTYRLNFYDASPTGTQYFDQQNLSLINANVTRNVILPKSNTFVPSTCSELIKNQACVTSASKPVAGNDTTIRGEYIDLKDVLVANGQSWAYVSGPSAANINANTGVVFGMIRKGDYYFKLANTTPNTCKDTIRVTVANNFPVASDCPTLAIPNEFISANYNIPTVSGPIISGQPTRSRPGGSALYSNIGTVNNGTTNVAIDMKVTFEATSDPADANGYIEFGKAAGASTDARWRAWDWNGGTEHTIRVEFFVHNTSTPATYSGVWNFSDISTGEWVYFPVSVLGNYVISPTGSTTINVDTVAGEYVFKGTIGTPGQIPTWLFQPSSRTYRPLR